MREPTILISFAMLQRRLLECLQMQHPDYFVGKWLLGARSRAAVNMDGEIWNVLKHGAGIMFKRHEPKPELVVDVHAEVNAADRIDAWRLQQFLESTGKPVEFDEAEAMLRQARAAGELVQRVDGGYALRN